MTIILFHLLNHIGPSFLKISRQNETKMIFLISM